MSDGVPSGSATTGSEVPVVTGGSVSAVMAVEGAIWVVAVEIAIWVVAVEIAIWVVAVEIVGCSGACTPRRRMAPDIPTATIVTTRAAAAKSRPRRPGGRSGLGTEVRASDGPPPPTTVPHPVQN